MESPRPWPLSEPVRSWPRRVNGWESFATADWSSIGPLLSMISRACCPFRRVSVSSSEPPGWLWCTAFSMTFSTMRRSSVALPATSTAARCFSTVSRLPVISSARAVSAAVMSGSSATWLCSSSWPFWARASVRKLSSSRSAWSRSTRSSAFSSRVWAGTPPGFAIATSSVVRIIASGVRRSCEALATNRRCASNAASNRSSSRSIVSASRRSSSRGPGIARRSLRFVSEIRSAVAVIVRSGANTRPATSHASTPETSAMIASTTPYPTCSWCRSTERCLESASANATMAGFGGLPYSGKFGSGG